MQQEQRLQQDVNNIGQIPIVKELLDVICQTTGMGFAAIARVTEDRWITCSVVDNLQFGLKPGDELEVKTTICNEVRQNHCVTVIDHVAEDPDFSTHHTPAMYGFQSYISMPITKKDGTFFGTLCAIDPKPNKLNNSRVLGMFSLFSDLIAFHLHAIEQLDSSETKLNKQKVFTQELEKRIDEHTKELRESNKKLVEMNAELQSFTYISSHDLQEPLRKIQTFVSLIREREYDSLSENGKEYFNRIRNSAEKMQLLINDLFAYTQTENGDRKFEHVNLRQILADVEADLREELHAKKGAIETGDLFHINAIPFQMRQLFFNLLSNAIKFSNPQKPLKIKIGCEITNHRGRQYCLIRIEDNGIGFDQKYSENIFQIFRRLHDKNSYEGTGIGLAIVKKIVDNHNGSINVKSVPDEGTTFEIILPIQQSINSVIREAKTEDIKQIQIVRNAVKENTLSDPALVSDADCVEFLTVRGKGWVCEIDGIIVGFSIADLKNKNVWALFIDPNFEKLGIGRQLHDTMIDWYFTQTKENVWLGTAPGTRAETFYQKTGWQRVGLHGKGELKFEMDFENWSRIKAEKNVSSSNINH